MSIAQCKPMFSLLILPRYNMDRSHLYRVWYSGYGTSAAFAAVPGSHTSCDFYTRVDMRRIVVLHIRQSATGVRVLD